LNDNTLASDLEQHHVTVSATGNSTSFLSLVVGFLPLIAFVGLFLWFSRRATRQLGGVMGIGSSRAKVYDEERPRTRFGDVGVRDPMRWPIVILLSNDIRHDLSAPLRSRCIFTWLDPPTPQEEIRIFRARFPEAPSDLMRDVAKLINCIRRDMPAVRDKPGLRESIDLIEALLRAGVGRLTEDVIKKHLCFLGKRRKEMLNLQQGLARMESAVRTADPDIDDWVRRAFADRSLVLEKAA
jgi:MoxR-like ATPase